jgi:hypothetical protein
VCLRTSRVLLRHFGVRLDDNDNRPTERARGWRAPNREPVVKRRERLLRRSHLHCRERELDRDDLGDRRRLRSLAVCDERIRVRNRRIGFRPQHDLVHRHLSGVPDDLLLRGPVNEEQLAERELERGDGHDSNPAVRISSALRRSAASSHVDRSMGRPDHYLSFTIRWKAQAARCP